jgi:hypothetical protein
VSFCRYEVALSPIHGEPSGTAKIGPFEYDVRLNGSVSTVPELNDLPVKVVGNSTIYLRDAANVRDAFAPPTNIVRQDGRRGALVSVLKAGNASTIDVVKGIRGLLPRRAQTLPREVKILALTPFHPPGVLGQNPSEALPPCSGSRAKAPRPIPRAPERSPRRAH